LYVDAAIWPWNAEAEPKRREAALAKRMEGFILSWLVLEVRRLVRKIVL
jgi:hypothetical protein